MAACDRRPITTTAAAPEQSAARPSARLNDRTSGMSAGADRVSALSDVVAAGHHQRCGSPHQFLAVLSRHPDRPPGGHHPRLSLWLTSAMRSFGEAELSAHTEERRVTWRPP